MKLLPVTSILYQVIQCTGSENTQTNQVDVIILIFPQILITSLKARGRIEEESLKTNI